MISSLWTLTLIRNVPLKYRCLFYPLDILKPNMYMKLKTKFKKNFVDISTFSYTFEKGEQENFFPLLKKSFLSPFNKSEVCKKAVKFSSTPTKKLAFSF